MTAHSAPLVSAALLTAAVLVAPLGSSSPSIASEPEARSLAQRSLRLLSRRRRAGVNTANQDVTESLVLLALGYRSGLSTPDVLEAVAAHAPGAAARDLRQVAAALRWGASESEAWGSVSKAWAPAARAVALAHSAGVPPGPLLLRAADDLGLSQLERLEVEAAKVSVRLVLPLGLVLLPAFVLTTVVPIVAALARQVLSSA